MARAKRPGVKNRLQQPKLPGAHLMLAGRSKHCSDAERRRKGAGGCLVAMRGRFGALEGRNGRILTENQYKIGHSLTDTVFVLCARCVHCKPVAVPQPVERSTPAASHARVFGPAIKDTL